MKLRFRENSLRLRVNQREVRTLAAGSALREEVRFPGDTRISYVLQPATADSPSASFVGGAIVVTAPLRDVEQWANGDQIGIYFDLPTSGTRLRVAIEKDLECIDAPVEERDPHAFPRQAGGKIC